MANLFTEKACKIIKKIPKGRVATYGQLATLSGNPRNSRMIARILHTYSRKMNLPWHRVINSQGKISLSPGEGFEIQKSLLQDEDVVFNNDKIDLDKHQWRPRKIPK